MENTRHHAATGAPDASGPRAAITIRKSNQDWRLPTNWRKTTWPSPPATTPFPPAATACGIPLWSWTVGHLYHEDREVTFFTRGKWLNTIFSLRC